MENNRYLNINVHSFLSTVVSYFVDTLFKVNLISLIYGYSADAGIA